MDEILYDYLEKNQVAYKEHAHEAVYTVEQHKSSNLVLPGLHCKSLFLKDGNSRYYLVCMPGEKRLDMKSLKNQLHVKELHFGSPEELKAELNVTPGSVSLFAMVHAKDTQLILDADVWNAPVVGFHPNINTSTLEINHENLKKFYDSLQFKKSILSL